MKRDFWVYIMANINYRVLYVGMTNDIARRVWEHKNKINEKSFSAQYNVCKLVWYEYVDGVFAAMHRERQLKNWKREWKLELIEKLNPGWEDLSEYW